MGTMRESSTTKLTAVSFFAALTSVFAATAFAGHHHQQITGYAYVSAPHYGHTADALTDHAGLHTAPRYALSDGSLHRSAEYEFHGGRQHGFSNYHGYSADTGGGAQQRNGSYRSHIIGHHVGSHHRR